MLYSGICAHTKTQFGIEFVTVFGQHLHSSTLGFIKDTHFIFNDDMEFKV